MNLRFDIEPPDAVITVDGAPVTEGRYAISLSAGTSKRVRIEARAKGFKSFGSSYTIDADRTVTIKLKKPRKESGGGGPGGLIEL